MSTAASSDDLPTLRNVSQELNRLDRLPSHLISSAQRHIHRTFRQLHSETALIELGHDGPLELVALVEKGEPEGEAEILEDVSVLRPGNHRARAHHGRDVAIDEGVAGEI